MKPTVGRQVHYYAQHADTCFNKHSVSGDGKVLAGDVLLDSFKGPFAATIVYVHDDGTVNLNVLWPQVGYGTRQVSEIVDRVPEADDRRRHYWVWPPRVG